MTDDTQRLREQIRLADDGSASHIWAKIESVEWALNRLARVEAVVEAARDLASTSLPRAGMVDSPAARLRAALAALDGEDGTP